MINLERHFIDCLVVVTLSSVSGVKLTVIAPARTQIVARLLWFCQRFSFMGSEWPVIMLSPRWIHARVYVGVDMSGPWAPVHVSLLVLHPSVLWMFLQVMGLYQLTLLFTSAFSYGFQTNSYRRYPAGSWIGIHSANDGSLSGTRTSFGSSYITVSTPPLILLPILLILKQPTT